MDATERLVPYYAARAAEYERIYHRDEPVRRAEQQRITDALQHTLRGRDVLEVACGTGYWTQFAAQTAASILATDATPEVLDIARHKPLDPARVRFAQADAYDLSAVDGEFDGALAAFWISHVPRDRLVPFITQLHARLRPGSAVFMVDNVFMPGVGGELVTPPGSRDTFKRRILADGSEHLVLKNYFTGQQLRELFSAGTQLDIQLASCFWWASYRI